YPATATPEISTLSLHDALPIFGVGRLQSEKFEVVSLENKGERFRECVIGHAFQQRVIDIVQRKRLLDVVPHLVHRDVESLVVHADRKSTRLNSSHVEISYAVFC